MVAPIPFGTGLRSKNVASLCAGLPLATTRAGAEGMGVDRANVILESNSAPELAADLARLISDRALWESLARNALPYAKEHFGRAPLVRDITGWLRAMDGVTPAPFRPETIPLAARVFNTTEMSTATAEDRATVSYLGRVQRARRFTDQQQFEAAAQEVRFLFGDMTSVQGDWRGFSPVFCVLARAYAGMGKIPEAEAALTEARALDSTAPELEQADLDIESARAATRLPSVQDILSRGEELFGSGRTSEAIEAFLRAIKQYPTSETAWNNVGVALNAIGKLDDALAALEHSIALRPNYREARLNRAQVLAQAGRREEATRALEELLALSPGDAEIGALLAELSAAALASSP
jgi:tetratricopeptide (TPR) repeat protein